MCQAAIESRPTGTSPSACRRYGTREAIDMLEFERIASESLHSQCRAAIKSRPTGLSPRVRVGDAELEKLCKYYTKNASELALFCILASGSHQKPKDQYIPKCEGIRTESALESQHAPARLRILVGGSEGAGAGMGRSGPEGHGEGAVEQEDHADPVPHLAPPPLPPLITLDPSTSHAKLASADVFSR